jgi:spermidine synthase
MIELARHDGLFGPIRILKRKRDGARFYYIGDGIHSLTASDGTSLFGYVHATKLLVGDARSVLVLGGAGGSLATMLARRGRRVTVVDIDPTAHRLAECYFALDRRVKWVTQDATAFLAQSRETFDAVVIDVCDAQGSVPSFATPDVISQALQRVTPEGSLVINLTVDQLELDSRQLARALASSGHGVTLYWPMFGSEANELLHVRPDREPARILIEDVELRPRETRLYLISLRAYVPRKKRPRAVGTRQGG